MDELLLLIVGGIVGFTANFLIELIKNRLEMRRLRSDLLPQKLESRITKTQDFIQGKKGDTNILPHPAWIKVLFVLDSNRVKTLSAKIREFLQRIRRSEPIPRTSPTGPANPLARKFDIAQQLVIEEMFERYRAQEHDEIRESLMAYLEEIKSFYNEKMAIQGVKFLLGSSNLIGRDDECDIVFPYDEYLSRKHAIIRFEDGKWFFHNLSPSNGSWINGKLLKDDSSKKLDGGEIILVGKTLFSFDLSKATEGFVEKPDKTIVLGKNRKSQKSTG